ncbi:MAG: hypothetical protein ACKOZZ_01475 [Bacteroidota bacterium]
MSIKSIWQFIFLLAIFGGVPVISWYYLQTGLDYRLKALAELGNMGPMERETRVSHDKIVCSPDKIKGKVHLGIWYPDGIENETLTMKYLDELHEQFKSRSDLSFYVYSNTANPDSLSHFLKINKLYPSPIITYFSDLGVQRIYYFMKPGKGEIPVALVDTSGMVRKHYNLASGKELTRLTEHLAMLLPIESTRDELIFKREKEK